MVHRVILGWLVLVKLVLSGAALVTEALDQNGIVNGSSSSTRDPRLLSFIRDLLFTNSDDQLLSRYQEVGKQQLQTVQALHPVQAQYQVGNNAGPLHHSGSNPAYPSGYHPGSVTTIPAYPGYYAPSTHTSPWVTSSNAVQQQQTGQLQPTYTHSTTSADDKSILKTLLSALGLDSIANGSQTASTTDSLLSRIFALGSSSMESLITRLNKFDRLNCIPRLLCQTVAKRTEEDAAAPVAATTTDKPRLLSQRREARFIKFQGLDTALEQFVSFLDLMNLKDSPLYPLLKGAYHGSVASRAEDCRTKFATCPFSDQQLVYYFNNYNGGLFGSI